MRPEKALNFDRIPMCGHPLKPNNLSGHVFPGLERRTTAAGPELAPEKELQVYRALTEALQLFVLAPFPASSELPVRRLPAVLSVLPLLSCLLFP